MTSVIADLIEANPDVIAVLELTPAVGSEVAAGSSSLFSM